MNEQVDQAECDWELAKADLNNLLLQRKVMWLTVPFSLILVAMSFVGGMVLGNEAMSIAFGVVGAFAAMGSGTWNFYYLCCNGAKDILRKQQKARTAERRYQDELTKAITGFKPQQAKERKRMPPRDRPKIKVHGNYDDAEIDYSNYDFL